VTGQLMCPACARTPDGCAADGCGPAGITPPKPVYVPADAVERARRSWIRRRSVLPRGRPPFGVSAGEAAHQRGDCEPATCERCGLLREVRGEGTA
jgi:hypothetical protein